MKIVTVVGARPQFIKASAVSRAIRKFSDVKEVLVHTGQHYDENMSAVFFDELDLHPPDHYLNVGSASHGAQTGRMLVQIEDVLISERPDVTLVYGDTNTTLAAALASVKLHVPVAHVEAGLRSHNRFMPEEINRVVTDHVSGVLFAPTAAARLQLMREGIDPERIHVVGDVMYDVALYMGRRAAERSSILQDLNLRSGAYILATVHRAENTDVEERLRGIMTALIRLSSQLPVVLPLHPRTRKAMARLGLLEAVSKAIILLEPVGYLDMVQLQRNARLIMTDSGGVQKEAFFHRVPALTLRNETEWTELVDMGWNRLVDVTSPDDIVATAEIQLNPTITSHESPYGNGDASEKIVQLLTRGVRL